MLTWVFVFWFLMFFVYFQVIRMMQDFVKELSEVSAPEKEALIRYALNDDDDEN